MESGFIKIYRKLKHNPIWEIKPFSKGQAWVDMLMFATYKKSVIDKRGNLIELLPGQIGVSIKGFSDRWGWSQSKVERFLKYLKNEEQIEYQKNSLTTLITIANWNQYQPNEEPNEEQTKNRRRTDEEQTKTKKKLEEGKEVKEDIYPFLNLDFQDALKTIKDTHLKVCGITSIPPLKTIREVLEKGHQPDEILDIYETHGGDLKNYRQQNITRSLQKLRDGVKEKKSNKFDPDNDVFE